MRSPLLLLSLPIVGIAVPLVAAAQLSQRELEQSNLFARLSDRVEAARVEGARQFLAAGPSRGRIARLSVLFGLDAFAGGFMGYLASQATLDRNAMRRAMVYGSVMASFTVEDFSLNRLTRLRREEVEARVRAFHDLVRLEA